MQFLRSLGPAVARPPAAEAIRAGVGAFIGVALAGLFVLSPVEDLRLGLYFVSPFGASALLLFAVPNSPLAQPWSVIVGNMVGATVGVAVSMLVADPGLRIPLAVGLTVVATSFCRALHPPAAAMAMTAALNPEAVSELGLRFVLAPVAVGTVFLVLVAALYARLTGRRYPFRQFNEPNRRGTADAEPVQRLGLSEAQLTEILERYRQSFNLGVEDLARLIGAAQLQAAAHRTGPMTAADIMSRNLVTVRPDAPLSQVADLFRQHAFTTLPVTGTDGHYLGIIFQIHVISRVREESQRQSGRFGPTLRRLLALDRTAPIRAAEIMSTTVPRAGTDTPVSALLSMMAEGEVDAVPVLDADRIIGIVTRTDMIAALARESLRAP